MLAVLSDDETGFNAALREAMPFYGIKEAIKIDWSPASTALLYARFASGDFELSTLKGRITLELAPSGSQWTGETRGMKWSGRIGIGLVFRVRYSYRDGDETPPADEYLISIAAAVEDAVIEVFQLPTINWGGLGVVYIKPPDCPEGYTLELLEDGSEVTVPLSVLFKIDVNY